MSNQPLLSIGMIVKNEIRCLEKCLKALQPLRDAIPCELVIADTGSTDGTREIAAQYADILFDFEWINDFAAARNAVIDRCSGKWFMTVDADEYLVPEIDELVGFLTGPQSDRADYATYIQRNHQSADMNGIYFDFYAIRMARRHPGLRYEGTIHEQFSRRPGASIVNLTNTILDHDGYAPVTSDCLEKKAERNLALLEAELEKEPDNFLRMLQYMEAAEMLGGKDCHYAHRGMALLQGKEKMDKAQQIMGAAIARQAVGCAVKNDLSEAEEWIRWTKKTFPDSLYTQLDVNYLCALHLDKNGRGAEVWDVGQEYFSGLKRYEKLKNDAPEMKLSSLKWIAPTRVAELYLILAKSSLAEGNKRQAFDMLNAADMTALRADGLLKWVCLFEKLADLPQAGKMLESKLLPISRMCEDGSERGASLWSIALEWINISIALDRANAADLCRMYINFPGTIGLCARLCNAQTIEEGQTLIDQIREWNSLMPLALQQTMRLGLVLPDAFYRAAPDKLHSLENDIARYSKDAVQYALRYSEPEQITDWHRLCFAFDFLCAVCMQSNSFEGEYSDVLMDRFIQVGALFLKEHYNPNVIANEAAIDRLPALHRFAWYVVRAVELRQVGDEAGFVRALRGALGQMEAMKGFVQCLMDSAKKRQNKECMKAASPELLALAEQVKNILAMYPADDPAVVTLKATPAYQQVAFLIEE